VQWSVESSRRKTDISAPPSENPHHTAATGTAATLRFGQGPAAEHYTFAVDQNLRWLRNDVDGVFEAQIDLPDLYADELLVPSLVIPSMQPYCYTCSLTVGANQWSLATVCSHPEQTSKSTPSKVQAGDSADSVSTHIDLFAIKATLQQPTLRIRLEAKSSPSNYLLVVSTRQHQSDPVADHRVFAERRHHQVPSLSQMAQPSTQRNGTCSPTALSMVMAYYGRPFHPATVDACKDPATGMYGVWPLNIVQAGLRGFTGAVELINSWEDLAAHQGPFVASISFAQGGLDGAPLQKTSGHLVVVCGTNGDRVLCNDPAAPSAATVRREYDFTQFTQAWLGSRGAAYVLNPAQYGNQTSGAQPL